MNVWMKWMNFKTSQRTLEGAKLYWKYVVYMNKENIIIILNCFVVYTNKLTYGYVEFIVKYLLDISSSLRTIHLILPLQTFAGISFSLFRNWRSVIEEFSNHHITSSLLIYILWLSLFSFTGCINEWDLSIEWIRSFSPHCLYCAYQSIAAAQITI